MISFAIVGNIASGKSTVENILQEKGYKVFDTDIIAHEVLNDFAEEIINQFDGHDISENGKVSREKLGKIVFIKTEDDIRLKRLMQRNKFTQEEALSRIKSQLPQEKKAKKADFVIENNSSIDVLQKYIERFIIQLEDNGET